MLLAIDVGNSNIVLGVFDKDELRCSGRLNTVAADTEIDYSMKLRSFLEINGSADIDGAIISSVVPALVRVFKKSVKLVCGIDAMVVGPGIKTGINIKMDNPAEIGADIIVGDVAAASKYPLPAVVFDFGTATTASVIDRDASHIGGAIVCGVRTALGALSSSAAQLPDIDIMPPSKIIAKNTLDAMRCGALVGTAAMVEGLVARFEEELGEKPTVIATGGLGKIVAKASRLNIEVDENLLLDGLKILYEKNKK